MNVALLLGDPVKHSLSPVMQNAAFRACGLDWQYELHETSRERLKETIVHLRSNGFASANVTIPHKEAVVEFLDDITDHASQIGAVNTIIKRDGRLIGDNTDVYGFTQSLRDAAVELRGIRAVVLGAGGAARAATFALAEQGAERITIINRTEPRAVKLAHDLWNHFPKLNVEVGAISSITTAHLIVNATSVGMSPNEDASPMHWSFPRGATAVDLVYRPLQTKFLRDAERAGVRPISGISMLVYQGAAAFKLWTGQDAPIDLMLEQAMRALRNREA
ncbi:MAG: shikimate dehydrogenase [Chloroflexi bacterium]|nr:shikimate dehydrogenase [Chloroflexota bacterium]